MHLAARRGFHQGVECLLHNKASLHDLDYNFSTPMEVAVNAKQAAVIKSIMDYSIHENEKDKNKQAISFAPLFKKQKWPETELLYRIQHIFPENVDILQHPLVTTFLTLKSKRMKTIRMISGIFSMVLIFSAFAYLYNHTRCLFSETFVSKNATYYNKLPSCLDDTSGYSFMWYIWIILVPFSLFVEVSQFSDSPKLYVQNVENYLDVALICASVICCPYFATYIYQVQKVLCIACMIGCGLNFMVVIGGTFNMWKMEIMMFRGVLRKSFILLIPYSSLVICFGFVMDAMLHHSSGYEKKGYAFIHAFSMMLGELSDDTIKLNYGDLNDFIVGMLLLSFILLIIIVMMNLLTALAVNISDEVRRDVLLSITKRKLQILHHFECLVGAIPWLQKKHFSVSRKICHFTLVASDLRSRPNIANIFSRKFIGRFLLGMGKFDKFIHDSNVEISDYDLNLVRNEMELIKCIQRRKKMTQFPKETAIVSLTQRIQALENLISTMKITKNPSLTSGSTTSL